MAFEKKKSLGQNFLRSGAALNAVVEALAPNASSLVLEIGPGEGALTEKLLAQAGRVIVVEKDHRLIPLLTERFAAEVAAKKLLIVEGDALETPIEELLSGWKGEYLVAGNIPYYITGALLRRFLSAQTQPEKLVFLMQKEVAERIAREKKESLLSLSVKAYGTPRYVRTVPRGAFTPAPNVDSAILLVSGVGRSNFVNKKEEEAFFALMHAGFASKRKQLVGNLAELFGSKEAAAAACATAALPATIRAEDIPLEKWLVLTRIFATHQS